MTTAAGFCMAATDRQQEIFDWITSYIAMHGYSPTVDEIRLAFKFRSKNGVMCHLLPLRRKRMLTWVEGKARTIRPIGGEA
jgi:repressor LexA